MKFFRQMLYLGMQKHLGMTTLADFKGLSLASKGPLLHLKWPLSATAKSGSSLETETSLPPAVQTFWKWMQEEGVVSAKTPVKAAVVPEGLGLVAFKDISRNKVVLQVPKRLWINPDAVAASEIGNVSFLYSITCHVSVVIIIGFL